jgi:hypothetical protein
MGFNPHYLINKSDGFGAFSGTKRREGIHCRRKFSEPHKENPRNGGAGLYLRSLQSERLFTINALAA